MRSILSLRSNITRRKANITEAHFLTECASRRVDVFVCSGNTVAVKAENVKNI